MPPRHLLAIPDIGKSFELSVGCIADFLYADVQSGRIAIADLAGASADDLQDTLSSLRYSEDDATVYLVTPPFAVKSLDHRFLHCFVVDKRIFPHLDLDHIPESIEMGWQDGLSLGIYTAESNCLKELASRSS